MGFNYEVMVSYEALERKIYQVGLSAIICARSKKLFQEIMVKNNNKKSWKYQKSVKRNKARFLCLVKSCINIKILLSGIS